LQRSSLLTIARDLGNTVEVSSGIGADDRVVQSPPDDLRDGDHVAIEESMAMDTRSNMR
jgi:hypothetical protein